MAKANATVDELRIALEQAVRLQTHYAELLNMHDGGERIGFKDADAWIARLRETGTLPRSTGNVSEADTHSQR
jgi:hypothetical protein